MTVAQLIEKLQNYDPTLPVYVGGDYYYSDEDDVVCVDGQLDNIIAFKHALYLRSIDMR